MKFAFYYWLVVKGGPTNELIDGQIFFNAAQVQAALIERLVLDGYTKEIPPIRWEREPESVFDSVCICQVIHGQNYYEVRQIAVEKNLG